MTEPRQVPPSFTPSGRPGRPPEPGDAIPVQGARSVRPATGGRVGRPDDAVHASVEPRVRRQSSREIPVTPPERRGSPVRQPAQQQPRQPEASPRSYTPEGGAPTSGRTAQRDGTRLMPSPEGAPRRTPSDGAPRRITGAAAGARAGGQPPAQRPAQRPSVNPGTPRPATGPVRVRKGRVVAAVLALVLVLVLAWPIGLLIWANGKITRVDALSGAANTPGTTYLIAGSDARGSGGIDDPDVSGARTDTIMLLHKPASGPAALISIPRDTFTEIPGRGGNKINAAFAWGGPQLLVKAVEQLSGLTVDHYVEVGFGGVEDVVDAVGGVELCLDMNVNEPHSQLVWTAGCHVADGKTALAFSRMRYQDPQGDIGRAQRQREVIAAVGGKLNNPGLLFNPGKQVSVASAGLGAIVTDEDTGIVDLARMALAFRAANGPNGVTGTPPIRSLNFRGGNGSGSSVQLDPDTSPAFWRDLANGDLPPGQVGGMPS
ncbi:LCP family protein [Xylanimonas sp. McL0601]|uniref:LCP family protein n=1 Tax=Xylanimonas sp. McL0601 TaxID=3414739 RepID=UPI003CEB0F77